MVERVSLRATRLRYSDKSRLIRTFEGFVLEHVSISRVYHTLQSRLDRGKNLIIPPRPDSLEGKRCGSDLCQRIARQFGHNLW